MKLHYKGANTNKLHDELIAAGIRPWPVESRGEDTWLGMPDDTPKETLDKIAAVIAAHDPAPVAAPKVISMEERVATLEAELAALKNGGTAK